jgi:hypothetical protein
LSDNVRQDKGFSAWFVPSKENWQIALEQGFDCQFEGNTVVEQEKGSKKTEIFTIYEKNNMKSSVFNNLFWTTTTTDNGQAHYIDLRPYQTIQFLLIDKTATEVDNEEICLHPMIAF